MPLDKIKKILEIDKDPKNAIFELFELFAQHIKTFLSHTKENDREHEKLYNKIEHIQLTPGKDGKDGKSIKGDKGDPGRNADEKKILEKVLKKIPKPKDGKTPVAGIDFPFPEDGKDADEEKIIDEVIEQIPIPEDGKDGLPPEHEWKGTKLRFKNPDGTWGVWINLIGEKGEKGRQGVTVGYGSAHDQRMKRVDLSSQCDGSNMTFIMPEAYKPESLTLYSTQFPIVYRPGVDYSTATQSFTLNSDEVGAPKSGQTLIALYVKL